MVSMETIIQQICSDFIKKITQKIFSGGMQDIGAAASDLLTDCKEAAIDLLEACFSEMNRTIREDKAWRKEQGLVLREKERPRELLTELGLLHLPRDYYYDKKQDRCTAVLDRMTGIVPYARVSDDLAAAMVGLAVDMSYAKSAELACQGAVSRQTVKNQILRLGALEYRSAAEEKRTVKELHVYADEDHVHMQKPHKARGKWSQMLPLVSVSEGTEREEGRRNRTLQTQYFGDEELQPKSLWKSVEGYISQRYDPETLERIWLHGEGARWIKSGLSCFCQVKPVMDGYHLEKRLHGLSRRFPGRNVRYRLNRAILGNDSGCAKEIVDKLYEQAETKEDRKYAADFRKYLLGNWEGIVNRKTLDLPGSCTEANVSHILSERFSRDPQGWSKRGLGVLSMLRLYVKNGGSITGADFKRGKEGECERYGRYAELLLEQCLGGGLDWSLFEGEPFIMDGASGTQQLLQLYGRVDSSLIH